MRDGRRARIHAVAPTTRTDCCRFKNAVNRNGTLVVKLLKALYGCKQSAKLWYKKLSGTLGHLGYVANDVEPCVFNKLKLVNESK